MNLIEHELQQMRARITGVIGLRIFDELSQRCLIALERRNLLRAWQLYRTCVKRVAWEERYQAEIDRLRMKDNTSVKA